MQKKIKSIAVNYPKYKCHAIYRHMKKLKIEDIRKVMNMKNDYI